MSTALMRGRSVQGCRHARPAGPLRAGQTFRTVQRRPVLVKAEAATGSTVGPKKAIEVTTANFDQIVNQEKLVLVDFWAPWCGPCRMISAVLDDLADNYKDKIVFAKLNTDKTPDIASQYGIRSIPTVMFFKKGQKLESVIGAVGRAQLESVIGKYL